MTENTFFRAFMTLRSQFYLHHRSQQTLTEIVPKITPNLDLSFNLCKFELSTIYDGLFEDVVCKQNELH